MCESASSPEAVGLGDVAGVAILGVCVCGAVASDEVESVGDAAGIGIPGVCLCGSVVSDEAKGVGDAAGICIPGVCLWGAIVSAEVEGVGNTAGICFAGMLRTSRFLAGCSFLTTALFLRVACFRFTFALGFGLLMPGMVWPSCCDNATCPAESETNINTNKHRYPYCLNTLVMIPLAWLSWRGRFCKLHRNARTS